AADGPDVLGGCPFCQRVLLTLDEKWVPDTLHLVNLSNKPNGFGDKCRRKVPVVKFDEK
ncbi:Uncharacterized protein TCM_042971 isoform 2, partial [Theobroma cacao]